jgi:hypothetical protein
MKTEQSTAKQVLTLGYGGRLAIGEHDLHCGDCFQIRTAEDCWHEVRIEHSKDGWYLIGLPHHYKNAARVYIGFEVKS